MVIGGDDCMVVVRNRTAVKDYVNETSKERSW